MKVNSLCILIPQHRGYKGRYTTDCFLAIRAVLIEAVIRASVSNPPLEGIVCFPEKKKEKHFMLVKVRAGASTVVIATR